MQVDVNTRESSGVVRGLGHGIDYTELLVGAVIMKFIVT